MRLKPKPPHTQLISLHHTLAFFLWVVGAGEEHAFVPRGFFVFAYTAGLEYVSSVFILLGRLGRFGRREEVVIPSQPPLHRLLVLILRRHFGVFALLLLWVLSQISKEIEERREDRGIHERNQFILLCGRVARVSGFEVVFF